MTRYGYARPYADRRQFATLTPAGAALELRSTYDPGFVAAFKAAVPADARRWIPESKVWAISARYAQQVADLCETFLGVRPEIPTAGAVKPKIETRILKVEYLGLTKDRGNGERSTYGYVDGGWNAVFPEQVLRAWFEGDIGIAERPDAAKTLYQQLGIHQDATEQEIRSAYRRLARQWHPDVCSEVGAAEVFRQVQAAYEVLGDPTKRRKYSAGLALAATVRTPHLETWARNREFSYTMDGGYRPLLRCGWVLCEGQEAIGRFVVSAVKLWEDVTDSQGRVMVTSWPMGANKFEVQWQ